MISRGVCREKLPVEPRSEAIPGKCGCCKRCQSTEILISGPGGYEVFSRMYYGLEVEVILGVNLAHAGPPLEQGTRGRQKRRATAHPGTRRPQRFPKGDE